MTGWPRLMGSLSAIVFVCEKWCMREVKIALWDERRMATQAPYPYQTRPQS
ncbi:hypothetical protein KCP78_10740 [Salmonella enterica subsp. enterica]|nr:hypothetical protein KCP78_10740 [Salmonella enterica subsp. enterica]